MIKPTLENFDTLWIKNNNSVKQTACIVKIEGIGRYAKHWKKQIKLVDALEMVKEMTLQNDVSSKYLEVYA